MREVILVPVPRLPLGKPRQTGMVMVVPTKGHPEKLMTLPCQPHDQYSLSGVEWYQELTSLSGLGQLGL